MDHFLSAISNLSLSDIVTFVVGLFTGSGLTLSYQKLTNKTKVSVKQSINGSNNIQSGRDSNVQK